MKEVLKAKIEAKVKNYEAKGWMDSNYEFWMYVLLEHWDEIWNIIKEEKKEYVDYLRNYYLETEKDEYGLFVDQDTDKIKEYWKTVNETVIPIMQKEKIGLIDYMDF